MVKGVFVLIIRKIPQHRFLVSAIKQVLSTPIIAEFIIVAGE
jgi:hypothetical protein